MDYQNKKEISLLSIFEEVGKKYKKFDDFIKKQSNNSDIVGVLKRYKKSEKDLDNIFGKLMVAGADEKASLKVISEPELLQKYLDLKQSGMSDLEVAMVLRKQISSY